MSYSSLKRSVMARVNDRSHITCHPHVYPQVEWGVPAFISQPQRITAVRPVLISRPTEGRRLSWPRWLGVIMRFARPKTVTRNYRATNDLGSWCCQFWAFTFVIVMAALWNRAGHYIFALWFLSFSIFFPRLISAVAEWMSTILRHMMWS